MENLLSMIEQRLLDDFHSLERMEMQHDTLWNEAVAFTRAKSPASFEQWFSGVQFDGMTDGVVRYTATRLESIGLPYEITRRGAIRAPLRGRERLPARAIVAHLDTLGAMVRELKPNGRLAIVPIGHWSSRFAEGTRLTVYGDQVQVRGTCRRSRLRATPSVRRWTASRPPGTTWKSVSTCRCAMPPTWRARA